MSSPSSRACDYAEARCWDPAWFLASGHEPGIIRDPALWRLCRYRHNRHTCALNVLQATGDVRKVALWLGHESVQTTEDYLRVDVTQRLGLIESMTPPQLRPGKFRPPDKLIASLTG